MPDFFFPDVTFKLLKSRVWGFFGGAYYRHSALGQIILPQIIAVAFQQAKIAPAPHPPPRCQTPTYFGAWAGSSRPAGEHVAPPSDRDLQGRAPPACGALGDGGRGLGGGGGAWGPGVGTRERPGRCLGRSCTAACAPPRPLPTFLCSGEGVLAAPRPLCAAHPAGAGPGEAPRWGRGGTWAGE